MKKNILLIIAPYLINCGKSVNSKLRSYTAFPYGVVSIATYLQNQTNINVYVEVFDCNIYDETDYMLILNEKLCELKPEIIGISMMFDNSYKYVSDIISKIKDYDKKSVIVMGGAAATSSYETILKEQESIDAICYYEGEIPFLKLVNSNNAIEYLENDISWITRKSLNEKKIPQKTLIKDLDDVIHIDYNLLDISNYSMKEGFSPFATKEAKKQFFVITSRGCPFNCSFCMHSSDTDKSMRYASVAEVIKHVKFLKSEFGMDVLTIYDDQVLLNKKRAKELFRKLAQFNLRIECPNGLSPAYIDEELAGLMRNAGMDSVCLAIESGSPYVLNNIMHKPLNIKMLKPVIQSLRKNNFWIQGFFVSGMPGETDDHRDETVKLIKEIGLDWSGFSLAIPTRGSDLYRICIENGYIQSDIKLDEFDANKYIINTPESSSEYVIKKTYIMNLDVNFVNNYRMRIGDYSIAVDGFKNVIDRYPDHAFAYYYLSIALNALDKKSEAQGMMNNFKSIIEKNNDWLEYIKYFNILE